MIIFSADNLQHMRIKLTLPLVIGFFALNMIMAELHEQVHIQTGYLVCGCYGVRDFNVWATCEQCNLQQWSFLATLAGPLFSCGLMWLGAWWMTKSSDPQKFPGFLLIFANLPFARIFTAFVGGGDEKVVIQAVSGISDPVIRRLIAIVLVTAICLPPMVIAYRKLGNPRRLLWITGFAIVPLIYGMLYHHMFLNWLLGKGIGSRVYILGTPNLILAHFISMLLLFLIAHRQVKSILIPSSV